MEWMDEAALLASDVVANNRMNRERGLRGVNSYARELRFDPLEFLAARRAAARWLDVGCGSAFALAQAADETEARGLAERLSIVGVDLVDAFHAGARGRGPRLAHVAGDVRSVPLAGTFDLVTCVHSLHYVADKLGLIEHLYGLLSPEGFLAAHVDPANVVDASGRPIRGAFSGARRFGASVSVSRGLLTVDRTGAPLSFGRRYLGARPSAGPNRTGQRAVDSGYVRRVEESKSQRVKE